jgi:hypothetical protein
MIEKTIVIGTIIIILNVIPLILRKFKLVSLTAVISIILMGLYLGGII